VIVDVFRDTLQGASITCAAAVPLVSDFTSDF
jgi:hypothetical protein